MLRGKLILFILILSTAWVNAQRTILTSKDYTEKKTNACTEVPLPVRNIRKDVTYIDDKVVTTKLDVYEFESFERNKMTSSSDGSLPYYQIKVTLDDFVYLKHNDGPWEKMPIYHSDNLTEESIDVLGTDEYWTESIMLNGRMVDILGNSWQQIISGRKGYRQDELFIDPKAGCLKTVTTYGLLSPRNITRQVTSSSEHDSTIKIEAPIK